MHTFEAAIEIIGINPFVFVPPKILEALFDQAQKSKGPLPVRGAINGLPYRQTLVRYSGEWRLYINTSMLPNSPKRIGERISIHIDYDTEERTIRPHPKWTKALKAHPVEKKIFDTLPASRQKEIVRYIANLKTAAGIDKNIRRAIDFLGGKGRFIGRDKP